MGSPSHYPDVERTRGSVYYLWTTVWSDAGGSAQLNMGGILPSKIFINGHELPLNAELVKLQAGHNTILLKYNNVGRAFLCSKSRFNIGVASNDSTGYPLVQKSARIKIQLFPIQI